MINKILTEAKRSELITKSKGADNYKGKSENRWTRKNHCQVANTVKDYNQIDMNTFWKNDELKFGIKIKGETDTYTVNIIFKNVLNKIQAAVQRNNNKLEQKIIYKALVEALAGSDVFVDCTCPDFKYRMSYQASKNNYKAGKKETRAANMTNPHDTKGAGCKHVLAALNNVEWLKKIASVINNYINYCKEEMEYNYSKYIFPKVYGIAYNKAIQMTLQDYDSNGEVKDTLESDEALINLSNALGKVRGRYKKKS